MTAKALLIMNAMMRRMHYWSVDFSYSKPMTVKEVRELSSAPLIRVVTVPLMKTCPLND